MNISRSKSGWMIPSLGAVMSGRNLEFSSCNRRHQACTIVWQWHPFVPLFVHLHDHCHMRRQMQIGRSPILGEKYKVLVQLWGVKKSIFPVAAKDTKLTQLWDNLVRLHRSLFVYTTVVICAVKCNKSGQNGPRRSDKSAIVAATARMMMRRSVAHSFCVSSHILAQTLTLPYKYHCSKKQIFNIQSRKKSFGGCWVQAWFHGIKFFILNIFIYIWLIGLKTLNTR